MSTVESLVGRWLEEADEMEARGQATGGAAYMRAEADKLRARADELEAALASQPKDVELLALADEMEARANSHVTILKSWLLDYAARLRTLASRRVTVDEATARRLDDYLGGEFDIRIGKQAAHAALTAALTASGKVRNG